MNPDKNLAPPMPNNEALRRILARFVDVNGNPVAGTPGGPIPGTFTLVTRVNARGPLPALAALLVPARANRKSLSIQNLDSTNTVWLDSNPNVTDGGSTAGTTLGAGLGIPYNWAGAVYVYCIAGSPLVEATEVYG